MYPVPPLPPVSPPPPPPVSLGHCSLAEESVEKCLRDVLRSCSVYLSDSSQPESLAFKYIAPIIQQGPTCGLVAVGMLVSLCPRRYTVEELLEDAQALGYSRSGEMFSVDQMADFVVHTVGDYFTVQLLSGGLASREDMIYNDLMESRALYLVPYDADANNSPACLDGHKAHWALLCGAASCQGRFCVLARQGKSSRLAVWLFALLDDSNANLREICPRRLSDKDKYVFHDLSTSMAGKYIRIVEK